MDSRLSDVPDDRVIRRTNELNPTIVWLDRRQKWINIAYVLSVVYVFGAEHLLDMLVVPVVMGWHMEWFINSVCHSSDPTGKCSPRDVWWVGILTLGEGFHVNHHIHPRKACHGFRRACDVDIVYMLLLMLERVGLVWNVQR
jgi:stearoyl-CoA desaturase (delta-9 desaturase)